jgi:hypothetical protein
MLRPYDNLSNSEKNMTHHSKSNNALRRLLLTLITLICLSAPTLASAHPHQHGEEPHGPAIHPISVDQMQTVALSNPTGSDPLTLNEMSAAKTVATNSTQMQAIQLRAASVIRPSQMAKLSTVQPLYSITTTPTMRPSSKSSTSRPARWIW